VQFIKLAAEMNGVGTAHVRRPRLTLAGEERAVLERMIRVTREELVRYRLSTEPHIRSNTAS